MAEAVIVEAVRSPVGKRNGGLSGVHPAELSAQVLNGLVERAGIDPGIVDDVIWGCVMQAGEQALDIGRTALLTAGWPESVARRDRRPPVRFEPAVDALRRGRCGGRALRRRRRRWRRVDVAYADGRLAGRRRQSVSRRASSDRYNQTPNQGIGAEMIAEQWGFDRTARRRVLARLARKGRRGTGFRRVRRPDRGDQGPGRQPGAQGRGHPPRHHHREDGDS